MYIRAKAIEFTRFILKKETLFDLSDEVGPPDIKSVGSNAFLNNNPSIQVGIMW